MLRDNYDPFSNEEEFNLLVDSYSPDLFLDITFPPDEMLLTESPSTSETPATTSNNKRKRDELTDENQRPAKILKPSEDEDTNIIDKLRVENNQLKEESNARALQISSLQIERFNQLNIINSLHIRISAMEKIAATSALQTDAAKQTEKISSLGKAPKIHLTKSEKKSCDAEINSYQTQLSSLSSKITALEDRITAQSNKNKWHNLFYQSPAPKPVVYRLVPASQAPTTTRR